MTTTFLIIPFIMFFVPMNFPVNKLIEKYGLLIPTLIGSAAHIAGAWIRCGVHRDGTGFNWVVAG